MRVKDRVAVITGAAAGIGEAVARLLVKEGARVVVADRNGELAEEVASSLGAAAVSVRADVSKSQDVSAMIDLAVSRFGRIDILVNNAGFGIRGNVVATEEADWDALMSVNLKGVYLCSKYAIPVMAAHGGGSIVNTASNLASVGLPDRAAYVASKGGVAALTRAMAIDHAAERIRVNCVAPGPTRSTYFDRMIATHEDPDGFVASLAARSPMNRMGMPAEIANVILWLASDEASFVTGAMYTVDGGATAW